MTFSLISLIACTGKGLASARETATKKRHRSADTSRDNAEKKPTESEEGEEGDDEGRALHAERAEVERREGRVVCLKATGNRRETGLVRDPNLHKPSALIFEVRTKAI